MGIPKTTVALALLCGAAAAETVTKSEAYTFGLDTEAQPRAIRTQAELDALWPATYMKGDSVTMTAPGGAETAVVSEASWGGTFPLALASGGLWTFVDSAQGTAQFTVRHSIFGTLGAGTEASPAKVVDAMELVDLVEGGVAGDGYVYALAGDEGLAQRLMMPIGYGAADAGDGKFRLFEDPNVCASGAYLFSLDTIQSGPDRDIRAGRWIMTYSGDEWAGDAAKASTLVVTSPGGAVTTLSLSGTGVTSFRFPHKGDWRAVLTMSNGAVYEAILTVPATGAVIYLR